MNDVSDWWDDDEIDIFSTLSNEDKISYMYDLYCDPDGNKIMYDDKFDDEVDDDSEFLDSEESIGVTENKNEIVIFGTNKSSIDVVASRIFMNGIILKLQSIDTANSKCKVTYKIIGVVNSISVN